jgi:opacity protein-like surface antigen
MKSKLVAAAVGAVMVLAPVSALAATQPKGSGPAVAPATANWQIPLTASRAFARATGSAQYQAQPGQREFQVEVERLVSLRGASVLVRVNGVTVGSMKVSSRGIAQLTRNTERGQRVPLIAYGSTVIVKTTTGVVIAAGRF